MIINGGMGVKSGLLIFPLVLTYLNNPDLTPYVNARKARRNTIREPFRAGF